MLGGGSLPEGSPGGRTCCRARARARPGPSSRGPRRHFQRCEALRTDLAAPGRLAPAVVLPEGLGKPRLLQLQEEQVLPHRLRVLATEAAQKQAFALDLQPNECETRLRRIHPLPVGVCQALANTPRAGGNGVPVREEDRVQLGRDGGVILRVAEEVREAIARPARHCRGSAGSRLGVAEEVREAVPRRHSPPGAPGSPPPRRHRGPARGPPEAPPQRQLGPSPRGHRRCRESAAG
mmetsp:Transcript_81701/g.243609  ORF Transcript_81701/g.243609 Transcript_81701/m.243609 type:complete len:236 (-) Transcript_81701:56-763(-)